MGSGDQQPADNATFAQLLRGFRTAAALSQEALAERAGLSVRAISDLERGVKTQPHLETVGMLADALTLDPTQRAQLANAARPARIAPIGKPPPAPAPASAMINLPAPHAALVAREKEVAGITDRLRADDTRLLTLVGAGGVGKTRLAIEVAAKLAGEFRDGVAWVDLTPLVDPGLVPAAVATVVGVDEGTRRPPGEAIRLHLKAKRFLLVLDNCEHVRGAVSALLADLLGHCPRLTVLATSRSRLRLAREQAIPVDPLTVPADASKAAVTDIENADAVRLLVQCARRFQPEFKVDERNAADVVAICRRLDGLPLAIELAAARLRVLAPANLRALLEERFRLLTTGFDDAPAQHRTLEAALAWSYEQLEEAGRSALQAMSIFAGGCTFDALTATIAHDDPIHVLTGLEELVDQSLIDAIQVPTGDLRYTMLDTVREYGRGKLTAGGDSDLAHDRHAAFFLEMAEAGDAQLSGPEQATWLGRLDDDRDNLRAALAWLESRGNQTDSLRLSAALWSYWARRGSLDEGRGWLERALTIEAGDAALQARAYHRLGNFYIDLGNYPQALRTYTHSLEIARQIDDQHAVANALNGLGIVAGDTGDLDLAQRYHEEALAIRTELGDSAGRARSLFNLGLVFVARCDYEAAAEAYRQSLQIEKSRRDIGGQAYSEWAIGQVKVRQGDFESAKKLLNRSLRMFQELGDRPGVGFALAEIGYLAYLLNEFPMSLKALRDGLTVRMSLEDTFGSITYLERIAVTASAIGNNEIATQLLASAYSLRALLGTPASPLDRAMQLLADEQTMAEPEAKKSEIVKRDGTGVTLSRAVDLALDFELTSETLMLE